MFICLVSTRLDSGHGSEELILWHMRQVWCWYKYSGLMRLGSVRNMWPGDISDNSKHITLSHSHCISIIISIISIIMSNNNSRSSDTQHSPPLSPENGTSQKYFIRTIIPFLLLQFSVGLCSSLQATFYPIEASSKGASAAQFGAVFGIIHLSLFVFGELRICLRFIFHSYFVKLLALENHFLTFIFCLSVYTHI